MSAAIAVELGARSVAGVDQLTFMMAGGSDLLKVTGYDKSVSLQHVEDTRALPFADRSFGAVLCNAVFEHIPQPRAEYVREVWRVLEVNGTLIINETPNKYLPADFHTLHLPLTNWLPSSLAHWIGVKSGRFGATRTDWQYSGWRGAGYYELVNALPKGSYRVIPELSKTRQRMLNAIGLPSTLFDPYPLLLIEKKG